MRDLVLGTSLFVLLMITLGPPTLSGARTDAAATTAVEQRPNAATPILSGAGFAVCAADTDWRAPSASFRTPAMLYDGKSVDGLSRVAQVPKRCWTEQPQVFLVGYEAVAYDAQDPRVASLRVRPAQGYRIVILTGPIRPEIALVADRRLDTFEVPAEWVTPQAVDRRAAAGQ